jgi:hypothetical protein
MTQSCSNATFIEVSRLTFVHSSHVTKHPALGDSKYNQLARDHHNNQQRIMLQVSCAQSLVVASSIATLGWQNLSTRCQLPGPYESTPLSGTLPRPRCHGKVTKPVPQGSSSTNSKSQASTHAYIMEARVYCRGPGLEHARHSKESCKELTPPCMPMCTT